MTNLGPNATPAVLDLVLTRVGNRVLAGSKNGDYAEMVGSCTSFFRLIDDEQLCETNVANRVNRRFRDVTCVTREQQGVTVVDRFSAVSNDSMFNGKSVDEFVNSELHVIHERHVKPFVWKTVNALDVEHQSLLADIVNHVYLIKFKVRLANKLGLLPDEKLPRRRRTD